MVMAWALSLQCIGLKVRIATMAAPGDAEREKLKNLSSG